ncbi:MAG: 16S rRNA C967 or C1407 C5-methylase (RsmB/RsmF family) [Halioglobus sp.]|jgi:16S rRNA C967 or C1407 C5-methylase (RsmB/RsmF family)
MFGLFRSSPLKNWQKQQKEILTRAFQAQRNGNIRLYSTLTAESEALSEKIDRLKTELGQ